MITLSQNVRDLLDSFLIETFYMVKLGDYKTTTYFRDVTLSNGDTYPNDGRLIGVDAPIMSSTVDRVQYKIILADPDLYFGNLFEPDGLTGYMGVAVEVRVGFINKETKQPLTNIEDTLVAYAGKFDSGVYEYNLETVGESVFMVNCTSPMSDLDRVNTFYTTKDAYQDMNIDDRSFMHIYEASESIAILWGK